jgi:hypothetical protein
MDVTEPQPKAKVAPARKLISKPRDLLAEYEGKHIALFLLSFGEHTFQDDEGATPIAEIVVVDVETEPARPIAALSISWRRVVGALRLVDRGTWQIGRLEREDEYNAVEFRPPSPTFDLEKAASQLGVLELQRGGRPLSLPAADADAAVTDATPAAIDSTTGTAHV